MQQKIVDKNSFYLLDVMKIICALLILCGHFISENYSLPTPLDYVFSLDIIAVPFFFTCSGFLLFNKLIDLNKEESLAKLRGWVKRLLKLYIAWSIVYLLFNIISWIQNGNIVNNLKSYLHEFLVYSSGPTVWFLPALALGGVIVWVLYSMIGVKKGLLITIVLYIIGSIMYTYSYCIPTGICSEIYAFYIKIFITSRNGIFYAPAFVALGACIAHKKIRNFGLQEFWKNSIISIILFGVVIAEAFFAKKINENAKIEFVIMLLPCTYFIVKTLLCVKVRFHRLYIICRKLSTEIFVSQRLILTAIPSIFPAFFEKCLPGIWFVDLPIIIMMVVTLSSIIILLSKKVKIFRCLA